MNIGLWARWVALHGVPRAFMAIRARRGDPLARMITSHGHVDDLYPVMEEIRARGPLVRTPFVWASVDHGLCREILRDKRFGVIPPADMELPQPLRMLLTRTDPGVANPVEPPAMVIVNPPDHTRYRQLVAQSFTPRAIARRLPVRSTHKLVSPKPSKAAVELSVVGTKQTTYRGRAIFANR